MSRAILPGATIGVLGSGQLGRMFAIAARRMGYRVHTLSPADDTPTGQVADVEVNAAYDDLDAVGDFARGVDVVTFEFENVPSPACETASRFAPVRPSGHVLHVTQHRLREKLFLDACRLPVAPFREVRSRDALQRAVAELGPPVVLKTAGWGYDGKGQVRIDSAGEVDEAWAKLACDEAIVESWIDFERELSVVAARGIDGSLAAYDVFANEHRRHILDVTVSPAPVVERVADEAREIACEVLRRLEVVGVLCVEFFLTRDGRLLVNELAPRPHNSGHLTFDACVTSQFEQQLRAICGLPMGSVELMRPAAMANLLGDLWQPGEPDWAAMCAFGNVKLHLYGKTQPRPGRKMGHLTALASSSEQAVRQVLAARATLAPKVSRPLAGQI